MEYVERIARHTTFVDDLIVFAILIAVRVNTTKFNLVSSRRPRNTADETSPQPSCARNSVSSPTVELIDSLCAGSRSIVVLIVRICIPRATRVDLPNLS